MANNNQSSFTITARFQGLSQITSSFSAMVGSAAQASRNMINSAHATRQAYQNMSGTLFAIGRGYSHMVSTGREIKGIWKSEADSLHVYVEEAMKLVRAQEKFKAINLSPAENAKAFQAVRDTVNSIKGLSLADTTETITDLHTAIGRLDEAIEALPIASKFRFAFKSLFGEKFSSEQLEQQIQEGFKYLEVSGAVAKGQAEIETRFNAIVQMMAATGGRVTPGHLLQVARRGGPAMQGLSVEGMRHLSSAIQELGPEGTGTSLMSLYQSTVAGVMKQSAATEFMRLGLLDPKKIEYGKAQKIKRIMPGANKLGALLMEDPLKAADALMEAMRKPLHGPAIDTSNMNKVREELGVLFGNRTAQRMMSILTTQRGQVVKEAGLSAGAKNIEELYAQALETPMGKMEQYENALRNLRAEIGLPLVNALTDLARAAMPFVRILEQHPKLALWALLTLKMGSAISQTAMVIRLSGITSLLNQTATSSAQAAGGVSRLRMALGSGARIGGGVAIGLAILLPILAQLKGEADEAADALTEVEKEYDRVWKRMMARVPKPPAVGPPEHYEQTNEYFAREQYKKLQSSLGSFVPEARREENPWWNVFGTGTMAAMSSGEIESLLAKRFPTLRGSASAFGQMMEAIEAFKGWKPGEAAKVREAARNVAGPDAVKEYTDALAKASNDQYTAITQLIDKERDQAAAADKMKSSLDGLSGAADALKDKFLNFKMPGESGEGGKDGEGVNPPTRVPPSARGSHVKRAGLVTVHPGEDIVPAYLTNRLASMRAMTASAGAGGLTVHVENHIGGDVSSETIARVEQATRRAVLGSSGEFFAMMEDYHKDRALGH